MRKQYVHLFQASRHYPLPAPPQAQPSFTYICDLEDCRLALLCMVGCSNFAPVYNNACVAPIAHVFTPFRCESNPRSMHFSIC